jgi:hypothetical protein
MTDAQATPSKTFVRCPVIAAHIWTVPSSDDVSKVFSSQNCIEVTVPK